jgi:hypothetical protein
MATLQGTCDFWVYLIVSFLRVRILVPSECMMSFRGHGQREKQGIERENSSVQSYSHPQFTVLL